MKKIQLILIVSVAFSSVAWACMTRSQKTYSKKQILKMFSSQSRKPAAEVKFAEGHSDPSWESRLGNLMLENSSDDQKIILSIPAVVTDGHGKPPFGDGQTNAKMSLGIFWKEKTFPVVGKQTESKTGKMERKYFFHESLKITDYQENPLDGGWFKVTPKGWEDSFYFHFDSHTQSVEQFIAGIPKAHRTFSENRVAPNPVGLAKSLGSKKMMELNFGNGYNKTSWYNANVHGLYPEEQGGTPTAIGSVITWGINTDPAEKNKYGPFKQLYTCFEARRYEDEKKLGVPSGAGWHHIGDAAETLLNTLETQSIPVATARTHHQARAAYGLTENITATWLRTDEALVNVQGEFHWYLNPYPSEVCTEIWVHNCVPNLNNNWGFNCK